MNISLNPVNTLLKSLVEGHTNLLVANGALGMIERGGLGAHRLAQAETEVRAGLAGGASALEGLKDVPYTDISNLAAGLRSASLDFTSNPRMMSIASQSVNDGVHLLDSLTTVLYRAGGTLL